jgi:glucosamine 6-phosphate synthetase-like amidotransferase/phosphosugar isomerase protein
VRPVPGTGLWQDVTELAESLAATLDAREGFDDVAALLGADGVRRIVATGNGAAYYVAVALWLASLEEGAADVVAVPSGLVARGGFRWRPGDALLAISSSGEFRDLVEAVDAGAPRPYAAITANADSTLGAGAAARALVSVRQQRAVTHTQAFCGAVAAALAVLAELTNDAGLRSAVAGIPLLLAEAVDAARVWAEDAVVVESEAAVAFGSGPAWAAALEAALLLKEVAGIPAEGVETREGATSAMMALRPGQIALSLPMGADPLLAEAETICAARGATLLRAPVTEGADRRLAAVTTFPAATALAERLGLARGLDVDNPAWTDDYYRVARSSA